ncbi:MAG: 16S rRNA (cytidine(1402)-2'-O)-methyltransferase [Candidatus Omnitrophica bacterium]|nr:16S rRNA (cytidine(1402)-2'-O)-methyltransferase [Candidatus Omnitrophota bacterium]MCM8828904.1 16S rRNA (cytidine(1402)-2'-O)-methyltransferase [Candidatus Omnitrophota bacterium]
MLFIVGTPIGNLEDITLRAINVLKDVDFIVSEDTRETRKLLNHLNIYKPLISYYRGREKTRSLEILQILKQGKKVALVCDRGTPGISDPAHYVVRMCQEQGIAIVPVPGPSALTASLSVSGFPLDSFSFYGFVPRKKKEKIEFLKRLEEREEVCVFFESVHRFADTMDALNQVFPERRLVICRELTKKFEQIITGTVNQLHSKLCEITLKGEFVLILGRKQC